MRCTKCGSDNAVDARFCNQCGLPLNRACPQCAHLNGSGAKFCAQCGVALGARAVVGSDSSDSSVLRGGVRITPEGQTSAAIDGERKTVTALFADIKGSTELMEDIDPEEARAIVDPALKVMIEAVHRYDGYIVQSTGDGIFALFGAPVAHEDHPQRALYAALRMQEELRRYSAKVVADGGTAIQGRIGINTGEVVVRSIQTGAGQVEYTPIGHTTNLASRMQTAAPVGSIAVSENTRRLCEGYFILKPLGATRVKGVSEPVNVHEVTGIGPLRTRLQRAVGRGLTKFVGREREMEALKHAAEQAKSGHGQIVAAMADAGVGKSRLFYEFKATSQSGWMVLEAFSVSHGKASAYLPLIDLLRNYFDISATDDERKRREKVAGRITILDRTLEDTLPYLFGLLGIVEGDDPLAQMDGQIRKRRTLEAIKRIVLRESLNQPLMVIFEDLHWIDEQTQEFLNLLADSIATTKLLLLVNYRPEYSHQWNSKTYYTQLRLDPLGKESAEEMLTVLLGDGNDLIPVKRLIIQRTEGNPFFIEEMMQALFDEGVLAINGGVKLARQFSQLRLPTTVQGVLSSRIDRLRPKEKELLQSLAVIGREFPLSQARIVANRTEDELDAALGVLQNAEFIYEQPGVPELEYVFKHALTQEVAYNSILAERRKLLHERAAQALEAMSPGQMDDHLTELARHYSRTDNVNKAIEYLGRAGQQAMQRCDHADAISSLTAAISLLPRLPDTQERVQKEISLQLTLGPALFARNGWGSTEAVDAYTRAQQLCEVLGDPPELFPTLFGSWVMRQLRGELRAAYEIAEELMRRAQRTSDPALLQYAHHALGQTSYWRGRLLAAREHLEKAIALYDEHLHRPLTSRYLGVDTGVHSQAIAALTLWSLGYPDQAIERWNAALALARRLAHPHTLVWGEYIFAVMQQCLRDMRAAEEQAERIIALSAEHGLPAYTAFMKIQLGWSIALNGRHEEGVVLIEQGLAASNARGDLMLQPAFLCRLAEALDRAGRVDDALGALAEAEDLAKERDNHYWEPEVHRLEGELLLRKDASDIAGAQKCYQNAIDIARTQSARTFELRATTSLARLLAKQGRRDDARAMLAEIYGWFTEGFDTADLKDAKALLDELNE
jgi:predicted ATPase/class 3 adenylate cyclase